MPVRRLKATLERLYTSRSRKAAHFRYALIGFDILTIAFFLATTPLEPTPLILAADIVIGLLILADFAVRLWIAHDRWRHLRHMHTIIDVLVIASLLLAPLVTQNLAFLRVLRTLRLLHSYRVLRDLRHEAAFFRRNEDVIIGSVNLAIFIFLITALVFTFQYGKNPHITNYIDALYFTVAALTTTGFGDIVLVGQAGRLFSVVIMVVGAALFLRLAQAIFRPGGVSHTCPSCGLNRHELDAVHCRHCGTILKHKRES